jgi:hypothetical protein
MRRLCVLVISLIALAGCGDDGSGPSQEPDYVPVAVGHSWEYEITGSGVFGDSLEIDVSGSLEMEITDTLSLDDGTGVFQIEQEQIVIFIPEQGQPDTLVLLTTQYWDEIDGSIYMYEALDDTVAELIHGTPIEAGHIWYPGPDDPDGVYEVISTDIGASVPFGQFYDCAQIDYTNTVESEEQVDILAPGTGWVQRNITNTDSLMQTQVQFQLVETNL